MQRIFFTAEAVARTRVGSTLGETGETLFALNHFIRRSTTSMYAGWRQGIRAGLAPHTRSINLLARHIRLVSDLRRLIHLFDVETRPPEETGDQRREVIAAFRQFHQVAMAPYWARIHSHLRADQDACGRILLSGGFEQLLNTLHPHIRCDGQVLELRQRNGKDLHLGDRGLTIVPSLFLGSSPILLMSADSATRPMLVYPVNLDARAAQGMWEPTSPNDGALGALVGRTRAAVLQVLTESRNTSQIGRRLGISSAAASQHTAVLREAGLITTRRSLNTVLHTVTPLGSSLLNGRDVTDLVETLRRRRTEPTWHPDEAAS